MVVEVPLLPMTFVTARASTSGSVPGAVAGASTMCISLAPPLRANEVEVERVLDPREGDLSRLVDRSHQFAAAGLEDADAAGLVRKKRAADVADLPTVLRDPFDGLEQCPVDVCQLPP